MPEQLIMKENVILYKWLLMFEEPGLAFHLDC